MELIIDKEFKELLFPLSVEAYNGLQADIVAKGCLDPLKTWNGILVDGHNRYEICTTNGIPFKTLPMEFDSRDDVLNWIDDNQANRRNLTPAQESLVRGRRYNRTKKQGERNDLTCGQNVQKSTTSQTLADQYGVNEKTIRRDGDFATAVEIVKTVDPDIERKVRDGEISSKSGIIEAAKIIKPHVANNSGNNEWYTPAEFIESARKVMGSIDFDPASSPVANQTVKAEEFRTAENCGLSCEWYGNVWMNPPYASDLVGKFADKFSEEFGVNVKQGIVLVNNATETKWFNTLVSVSSAVVFPASRIKFIDPLGNPSGAPLQGQAIIYAGDSPELFLAEFSRFGWGGRIHHA